MSASDRRVLQGIADRLRNLTSASRTTIRVVDPAGRPVLVAESLAANVPSLHDGPQPAVTTAPTYIELERTRQILIQNDCRVDGPRPPASLIDHYRVYAQLLAPVFDRENMVATISVHQQDTTRNWSEHEIAGLRTAVNDVVAALIGEAD